MPKVGQNKRVQEATSRPRVLVVNSYAGSIAIAAHQLGCEVVASLEDAAYGIEAQKLNFPGVRYVDKLPWPDLDLRGVMVVAHPPCSAFSTQNFSNNKKHMGEGTPAFACHERVMAYALGNRCSALAIESVPGAERASATYARYAADHGYGVFFVKQNAVTFGVPQWRQRFWTLFAKSSSLTLRHEPRYVPLRAALGRGSTPVARDPELRMFLNRSGMTEVDLVRRYLGRGETGGFLSLAARVDGIESDGQSNHRPVRDHLGIGNMFGCKLPRALDPDLWAPTVLSDCVWFCRGKKLSVEDYMSIMGFPVDYRWPPKMFPDFRRYLSKGVCPPVAAWVIQELAANLGGKPRPADEFTKVVEAGGTVSFNVTKAEAELRMKGYSDAQGKPAGRATGVSQAVRLPRRRPPAQGRGRARDR